MTTKKSLLILVFISIIPLIKGYDSSVSKIFEFFLNNRSFNNAQIQIFDMLFILGFAMGSLLGGIGIDLWNPKKLVVYSVLSIVISSGIMQLWDANAIIIGHRFILGTFLGLLMVLFQVYLFEITPTNHKGKLLVIFFLAGSIGWFGFYALHPIFTVDGNLSNLKYTYTQLPYAILPLLVLLIIRHIPNKLYPNHLNDAGLKRVLLGNKKFIPVILVLLSTIAVFGNANVYFFATSQLIFENKVEWIWTITSLSGILGSIISILLIDKVGRKKLFLFGCKALILISFVNSFVFLFINKFYWVFGLVSLYYFLFSLTIGMSALIIVLEYLPSKYRGRGLIVYSVVSWIPHVLKKVYINVLDIKSPYTLSISSLVIFGIILTGFFFIRKYLIDTKGLTLDEIESAIIDKNQVS